MKDLNTLTDYEKEIMRLSLEMLKNKLVEGNKHLMKVDFVAKLPTFNNADIVQELLKVSGGYIDTINGILKNPPKDCNRHMFMGEEMYSYNLKCPECGGNKFDNHDTPHPNNSDNQKRCVKCNIIWAIEVENNGISYKKIGFPIGHNMWESVGRE